MRVQQDDVRKTLQPTRFCLASCATTSKRPASEARSRARASAASTSSSPVPGAPGLPHGRALSRDDVWPNIGSRVRTDLGPVGGGLACRERRARGLLLMELDPCADASRDRSGATTRRRETPLEDGTTRLAGEGFGPSRHYGARHATVRVDVHVEDNRGVTAGARRVGHVGAPLHRGRHDRGGRLQRRGGRVLGERRGRRRQKKRNDNRCTRSSRQCGRLAYVIHSMGSSTYSCDSAGSFMRTEAETCDLFEREDEGSAIAPSLLASPARVTSAAEVLFGSGPDEKSDLSVSRNLGTPGPRRARSAGR